MNALKLKRKLLKIWTYEITVEVVTRVGMGMILPVPGTVPIEIGFVTPVLVTALTAWTILQIEKLIPRGTQVSFLPGTLQFRTVLEVDVPSSPVTVTVLFIWIGTVKVTVLLKFIKTLPEIVPVVEFQVIGDVIADVFTSLGGSSSRLFLTVEEDVLVHAWDVQATEIIETRLISKRSASVPRVQSVIRIP